MRNIRIQKRVLDEHWAIIDQRNYFFNLVGWFLPVETTNIISLISHNIAHMVDVGRHLLFSNTYSYIIILGLDWSLQYNPVANRSIQVVQYKISRKHRQTWNFISLNKLTFRSRQCTRKLWNAPRIRLFTQLGPSGLTDKAPEHTLSHTDLILLTECRTLLLLNTT